MWSTAYAEGSIPQVMSGHSYYRALCAHVLSVQVIASVLLSAPGVLDQVDAVAIRRTWYIYIYFVLMYTENIQQIRKIP